MSAVKESAHLFASEKSLGLSLPLRKLAIYFAVVAVMFLLGFVPMWLRANEAASQRDAARSSLRLSSTENMLASAVIDAQRGEYEVARQTVSDFFTSLREQFDTQPFREALTPEQREGLRNIMASRDDIITLLARSDPAAAARLSELYVSYRRVMISPKSQ